MTIEPKIKAYFKRLSPFGLFILAISPILISLMIHITVLILSGRLTWSFGKGDDAGENAVAQVVLEGQRDDKLKFQGADPSDSFMAEDSMEYPVPEKEYRPATPDVEFYPEPSANDSLDIISVEAAAVGNQWATPSSGSQPLYTGAERLVGSFSEHIQQLRAQGLDIVFVFDSTGSMSECLQEVKYKIENLAVSLKKLVPTCRIGLVTYRDKTEVFVTKIHPLTYGISSLHDFLIGIDAIGGGDVEEAVEAGLKVAVEEINWNPKSRKFILLIGDAPPHKADVPIAMEFIKRFREEMGGTLSAMDTRKFEHGPNSSGKDVETNMVSPEMVLSGADNQAVMDEFRVFAELGGGECARMIDEEKVVKHMLLFIFGSKWEMYLDEFMKNL